MSCGVGLCTLISEWEDDKRREEFRVYSSQLPSCLSSHQHALGARGHLPGGHIEDTLRFLKQCVHTLPRGYMLDSFEMYPPLWSQCDLWSHAGHFWNVPPKYPLGTFWMKTMGSFTILFAMCPPWVWATHWDFFQNVSWNVITMSPGGSFQSNHNETSMWFNFTTNPQRAHEVAAGYIVVTLQDTFWKKPQWVAQTHGGHIANNFVKEPMVFIQNVPRGYFGGTFQKDQHVITGHIVIKVGGTFQKSPACTPWVMCGKIA